MDATPLKGFRNFSAMWLSAGAQEAGNQVWQRREGQKDCERGLRWASLKPCVDGGFQKLTGRVVLSSQKGRFLSPRGPRNSGHSSQLCSGDAGRALSLFWEGDDITWPYTAGLRNPRPSAQINQAGKGLGSWQEVLLSRVPTLPLKQLRLQGRTHAGLRSTAQTSTQLMPGTPRGGRQWCSRGTQVTAEWTLPDGFRQGEPRGSQGSGVGMAPCAVCATERVRQGPWRPAADCGVGNAPKQHAHQKDLDGPQNIHGACERRAQVEAEADSASELGSQRARYHVVGAASCGDTGGGRGSGARSDSDSRCGLRCRS